MSHLAIRIGRSSVILTIGNHFDGFTGGVPRPICDEPMRWYLTLPYGSPSPGSDEYRPLTRKFPSQLHFIERHR